MASPVQKNGESPENGDRCHRRQRGACNPIGLVSTWHWKVMVTRLMCEKMRKSSWEQKKKTWFCMVFCCCGREITMRINADQWRISGCRVLYLHVESLQILGEFVTLSTPGMGV